MKPESEINNTAGAVAQERLVRLVWSLPAPPCEECRYDHTRAETPFGPFLLTWKSWKSESWQDPGYGFDETPWGEVEYRGWNSVEEAQEWAESEMDRRIKKCLANDERVHHYQRGRALITGLGLQSGKIIETERLVVVVTARLVSPFVSR